VKSGLPSENRGTGFFALLIGSAADAAAATVPGIVTVSERVTGPPTPLAVSVYVVVAAGEMARVPRGVTRPMFGSIVIVPGFSVAQVNFTAWPRWIVFGSAVKETIRTGSRAASWYADRPRPAAGCSGAAGAC
jgi:hypothetical protein